VEATTRVVGFMAAGVTSAAGALVRRGVSTSGRWRGGMVTDTARVTGAARARLGVREMVLEPIAGGMVPRERGWRWVPNRGWHVMNNLNGSTMLARGRD